MHSSRLGRSISRRDSLRVMGGLALGLASPRAAPQPPASPRRAPNVLFFLTDDQRQDALSAYGNPVLKTPHMDRIGAGGLRFAEAFVTNALCAPSRASILTRLYSHAHGVRLRPARPCAGGGRLHERDRRMRRRGRLAAVPLLLATCVPAAAEPAGGRPLRKPKDSWTIQVGLSHSADDGDHYAVSGLQGRFALFALDRRDKSDRLGGLGLEVGLYPYPVISRAYVPGVDADPETPGKYNFWEAVGLSYYTPRIGPLQFEAGARLAFINPAERVLTSPNGCGVGNRAEPHCNAYIKESLKTLDTIFFPSFRGDRGVVTFVGAALIWKSLGARLELAQLNSGGSRLNARGLRFGLTARP